MIPVMMGHDVIPVVMGHDVIPMMMGHDVIPCNDRAGYDVVDVIQKGLDDSRTQQLLLMLSRKDWMTAGFNNLYV
jgi:hypothetical protein